MTNDKQSTTTEDAEPADDGLTQSERFTKAAQELGTDDDPGRFKERVRQLAKSRDTEDKPKRAK